MMQVILVENVQAITGLMLMCITVIMNHASIYPLEILNRVAVLSLVK